MENSVTRYPIKIAARRTGLSTHQIRVWERRYQAVVPQRSAGGHRLYTEDDVQRLLLLHQATAAGHQIGQIAGLAPEELRQILRRQFPASSPVAAADPWVPDAALARCLDAVQRLDPAALEEELARAHAEYGHHALVEKLIAPLMTQIGELWHQGAMRIAGEHLSSAVVRSFVGRLDTAPLRSANAPILIATTPAGQRHELGALLAAHAAAAAGWHALYLGADLPAEEIAGASRRTGARAVVLSLIYPSDDPYLAGELARLRSLLNPQAVLLAGGRAAPAYQSALAAADAHYIPDLAAFRRQLNLLLPPPRP